MAWTVTIAGVDRTAYVVAGSGEGELVLNERSTFSCLLLPGLLPARLATVVVADGATTVFGGIVLEREVVEFSPTEAYTRITCGDYFTYADWSYTATTFGYAAATILKTVLTDLVTSPLSRYSITLDVTQVNGPAIDPFDWDRKRVSDGIRELSERTGYVGRIDSALKLKMFVPGTDAAPVTMTDADPNCRSLTWRDNDALRANYIALLCGPTGTGTPTQAWTASGIATSWEVDIQAVAGGWQQGYVLEGATARTVSLAGGGGYYYWADTTGKGTISVGTGATPGAGVVLTFVYTAQYPFLVTATSGATPVIEFQAEKPDVMTLAAGQDIADELLTRLNQANLRELTITTDTSGFLPGQQLTINLTPYSFNATAIIWSVRFSLLVTTATISEVLYTLTATENSSYVGNYLDQWRAMTGGGGSTVSLTGGGGSTVVLSSPFYLGGSRIASVPMAASPAYTPVLSWVPYYATATFTGTVRVTLWARTAGVGVTARLYDTTAAAAVGTSSTVTGVTPTEVTFTAILTDTHAYRLEVVSNTASESAYAIGALEAA